MLDKNGRVEEVSAEEYQRRVDSIPKDTPALRSKYHREIKPGVWVDVYDVLSAWGVSNPALSHLVKKALQPGQRGHKDRATDLDDIVKSAIRAKELG